MYYQNQRIRITLMAMCALWAAASQGRAETAPTTAEILRQEARARRADGVWLQRQGDLAQAVAMLQKATYLDASYASPHNDLGIIYEALGRLDDAEREYLTALALDPGYAQAHSNVASLYERRGQTDLALHYWKQRYLLGHAGDPWTTVAEEHLIELGYLDSAAVPGAAPSFSPHVRAARQGLARHATILQEFETMTDPDGSIWAGRPQTSVIGAQTR